MWRVVNEGFGHVSNSAHMTHSLKTADRINGRFAQWALLSLSLGS